MNATVFTIEPKDIQRLDDTQLTQLLRLLLYAETETAGIALSAVDVALNITVADGGEDGSVHWKKGPPNTAFIPNRHTLFQCKATKLGPTGYGNEIMSKPGVLKPRVESALNLGAAYVAFTTQEINGLGKQKRITRIRTSLTTCGKTYSASCTIEIYDAGKIAAWASQYPSAIAQVGIWVGKTGHHAIKSYAQWGTFPDLRKLPFSPAPSRAELMKALQSGVRQERACIRLTGLSGMGKSRTAYEIFSGDKDLQSLIVYLDPAYQANLPTLISSWSTAKHRAILIVDNCDPELHEKIANEVRRTDSRLTLLSLDYQPDKVSGSTNQLSLQPMMNAEILALLTPIYGQQLTDLSRIVHFAQGFPQMAVLLADARVNEDPQTGYLTEDILAQKLLWQRGETENTERLNILMACSLFDLFGIDGSASNQLQHIAGIAGVKVDIAYECIAHYRERGIIDKRGRYAQVVPKPLAMRLAGQWWKRNRPEKQLTLINSIPDDLVDSFCSQIEKMDFHSEVKELTAKLCGPNGPFGQAEEIFTVRGSRLFRSLVHVNPEASSSAVYRAISPLSPDYLMGISGHVRRHLVHSLELLAFRASEFDKAAWCLLLLAASENETWGNNATGQFTQLFGLTLSGTEANPEKRIAIIGRGLSLKRLDIDVVLLKAIDHMMSTGHSTRMVGAEHQGTKAPLQEWRPTNWGDAFAYRDQALDLALLFIERGAEQAAQAKQIIGRSIGRLLRQGREQRTKEIVQIVIAKTGIVWPEAAESLTNTLSMDSGKIPPEAKSFIESLLALLTAISTASLSDKIRMIVTSPPWEHRENAAGHYVDIADERASAFAAEIAHDVEAIKKHFDVLLIGEQKKTYVFGASLIKCVDDRLDLIASILQAMATVDSPNPSLLFGCLRGLYESHYSEWSAFLEATLSNPSLAPQYARFVSTGKLKDEHLSAIIDLVRVGRLDPLDVNALSYGGVASDLPPQALADFCVSLSKANQLGTWPAINVLFMYLHFKKESIPLVKDRLSELLLRADITKGSTYSNTRDIYHWHELCSHLLKLNERSFAGQITDHVLGGCAKGFEHDAIWSHLRPLITELFELYPDSTWPMVGKAILSFKGMHLYWLELLIESSSGDAVSHPGALSALPPAQLIAWCHSNGEAATVFVAGCIRTFEIVDKKKRTTALFNLILKEFSSLTSVTDALRASLDKRSWSGSLVPILQSERDALQLLVVTATPAMRTWLEGVIRVLDEEITIERCDDEERSAGIF